MPTQKKTYEPDRQAQLTNTVYSGVRPTTDKYASTLSTTGSHTNGIGLNTLDTKYKGTPTAYLPTQGATSGQYLGIATSDASKNANKNVMYSAVTANGSSYVPRSTADISKLTYDTSGSYTGGVGGSGGISGRANFQASQAYNDAMAYTNQLLSQLSSGRTAYTDQINSLMDTINNRASFSYDPDTDPLFQQYLASSMESGKTAMQNTMAQASALTGGYGSSYAQAVGNASYNDYVQDAYNNLPEYYQTALDAYNGETNNLYNKLNMYNVADQTEYARLSDTYQNNLAMANDMYGKEYNNYWDSLNYNTSIDQYNADLAYKYASLAQDQAQFKAKMDYQAQQDALSAQQAVQYTSPTETQYSKAMKAYSEGGIEGVKKYVASLSDDIDVDAIMDYVWEYGTRDVTAEQNNEKYKIKQRVANGK